MGDKKPFERLPKVVKPKHYDLFLQPDLKAFTFNGHTKISVDVGHLITISRLKGQFYSYFCILF
jgi:puromycin-sensitive aminopeptidase